MSISVFCRNPSQDGKIYFLKKRTGGVKIYLYYKKHIKYSYFYVRLNLIPHDETDEIKERSDVKDLYIRKCVASKQTSTYVVIYL